MWKMLKLGDAHASMGKARAKRILPLSHLDVSFRAAHTRLGYCTERYEGKEARGEEDGENLLRMRLERLSQRR